MAYRQLMSRPADRRPQHTDEPMLLDVESLPPTEFGSALRALRSSRGLSLGDLARLVNYSKSHLSRVENGKKQPTSDLARHCDDALDGGGGLIRIATNVPRRRARATTTPAVRQLPRVVGDFVGRADLLRRLDMIRPEADGHRDSPLVLVDGPVGVGKTETVLRWGHAAAEHFPDGTLFTDLKGFDQGSPPLAAEQVLRRFLSDLGASGADLEGDAQDLGVPFRSLLNGKRMLVVLDNAARPEQVRALLPASPGCMTVVTSRNRMPGLLARDGALHLRVPPLVPEESIELLAALNPDCRFDSRTAEYAEACGHLPLLIRILSRRNMGAEFYDRLRSRESAALLRLFSTGDDDYTSLRALLQGSYDVLSPEAAWAFRLLGTRAEGGFTVRDAARLLDTGQSAAEELLSELADIHLLRYRDERFGFDPVHRAFAVEQAGTVVPEPGGLYAGSSPESA